MVETLAKFAKFLHSIGKGKDENIAVKPQPHTITVSEIRVKSNVINRKYCRKAPSTIAQLD